MKKNNKKKQGKYDKDGRLKVLLSTKAFSDVGDNFLITNTMYAYLLDDIKPCLASVKLKEKLSLKIYQSKDLDDDTIKAITIGFKNYLDSVLHMMIKQLVFRLLIFTLFFIIGISIEIILWEPLHGEMSHRWIFNSLEILATLFIWEFGSYLAFEYFFAENSIRRYRQLLNAKLEFKKWE